MDEIIKFINSTLQVLAAEELEAEIDALYEEMINELNQLEEINLYSAYSYDMR